MVATFVLALALFAGLLIVTIYLQVVLGFSAARTGVALLPTLTASSGYTVGVMPVVVLLGAGGPLVMATATNLATAGAETRWQPGSTTQPRPAHLVGHAWSTRSWTSPR